MGLLAETFFWNQAIGWRYLVALGLVTAGMAGWVYLRTMRQSAGWAICLLAMRLIVLVTLLIVLAGPSVLPESQSESRKPTLRVFVDTSASMLTPDADGKPRLAYTVERWLDPQRIERLNDVFDLRLYAFDTEARRLSPSMLSKPMAEWAGGSESRAIESIDQVLRDVPFGDDQSMVLWIGDGRETDPGPNTLIQAARDRGVSIHTVTVGADTEPTDVALLAESAQPYLMAGEEGQIRVRIEQGGPANRDSELTVQIGDEPPTVLPLKLTGRPSVRLTVPIKKDKPGRYEVKIAARPLPGEKVTDNNATSVFVEVTDKRMNVLVLEGEPYWDTKFLAHALRTDRRIAITQISQLIRGRPLQKIVTRAKADPRLPSTAEDLAGFDLIILGRGMEHLIGKKHAELLEGYVRAGGNLVLARGRAYNPDTPEGRVIGEALSPIEPVHWAPKIAHGVHLKLTPAGRNSAAFGFAAEIGDPERVVAELPPIAVLLGVRETKPATVVLAEAANGAGPAVVSMAYGRGQVFAVLGEGLWKWRLLPPDLKRFEGAFDTLWSSTARALVMGSGFKPGEQVSLESPTRLRLGDAARFSVTTRLKPPDGYKPALTVVDPTGRKRLLGVGSVAGQSSRMAASFVPDRVGVWTAELNADPLQPATQSRRFSVYFLDTERLRPAAQPALMQRVAEQTGGQHRPADGTLDLAAIVARQQAAQLVPPTPRFVWDKGFFMLVLVLWVGLEWIGRRQAGWL